MILGSALLGLFLAAFVAATLVPFQSEVIFAGLVATHPEAVLLILLTASVGNTLGSFVNYAFGRGLLKLRDTGRLSIPDAALARAQGWYARWGVWSLLLSWMPLGDVLTVVAGMLRTPLWLFALLVAIAKTGRYLVLALVTLGLFG
ncbi:MAG: hypothetical protein RIT14_388 [Pseudomonadota bacterium]|jgi:membrane protein YqaA with SNARE-associated domain